MKTNLLAVFMCFVSVWSIRTAQAQMAPPTEPEGLNMVKFNAMSLLGGKFSFEYERMLTSRIAAGAAISLRPNKGLPFGSTVKNIVDDEELNKLVDGFSSSNFSITPELRLYTSRRGAFRGFYIAPYAKYASYGTSIPFDFDINVDDEETDIYSRTETIPLKGDVTALTVGLSFGVNFKLSRNIHLDWRIMGPGYGSAKGDIVGKMSLDSEEQSELRESLADLKTDLEDLPLSINIDYDVHADGANIKIKRSPWAGVRSGLAISYRF